MFIYRGREGMWAWVLHRVAGVAILLFLLAHIVDTALISYGPKLYNEAIRLYTNPLFRVGEVLVAAAVFYHGLNGLRIILIDFWQNASLVQRRLFYAAAVIFVAVIIPTAIAMLSPVFGPGR